jgi:hypothetical protein
MRAMVRLRASVTSELALIKASSLQAMTNKRYANRKSGRTHTTTFRLPCREQTRGAIRPCLTYSVIQCSASK